MHYLRHSIKYILWLLLTILVAMVIMGIVTYKFDIKWYVEYLNTRNIQDVSITSPITMFRLFVPTEPTQPITLEELLEEDEETMSWSLDVDVDFESFFGDFNQQDRASTVMTGADFGFVSEAMTWSVASGESQAIIELTEEEQKQLFVEQLRLRELRMQQEAELQGQ